MEDFVEEVFILKRKRGKCVVIEEVGNDLVFDKKDLKVRRGK